MFKLKSTISGRLENSSGVRIRTWDLRVSGLWVMLLNPYHSCGGFCKTADPANFGPCLLGTQQ